MGIYMPSIPFKLSNSKISNLKFCRDISKMTQNGATITYKLPQNYF